MTVSKDDTYVITGFQAPITVVDPKKPGARLRYEAGDTFKAGDWPNYQNTVPRAEKSGYIKRVEHKIAAKTGKGGDK